MSAASAGQTHPAVHGVVATCWTSAGKVAPLDAPEVSPFSVADRLAAVAAAGYVGLGIAQDDLAQIRATTGFADLRRRAEDVGLKHLEVELLTDWWETGERRTRSDEVRRLLMEAAEEVRAPLIKIGTAFGTTLESIEPLVEPLRQLAEEAAERGTRVALEPMPFSMVASVPMAVELVRAADHPAAGVLVDSWHVFRAGTSLSQLRECLTTDVLFGVELDDADADVVGTLFEDTINRRRLCGEGSFDLVGLVRTLAEIGWSGPWGVEIISEEFRKLPLDEAVGSAFDAQVRVLSEALDS